MASCGRRVTRPMRRATEKGERMATHLVRFTLPERTLGNSDVAFTVFTDGERLGKLKVSKGALVWSPANKKRGYELGWSAFDRMMQEQGHKERAHVP
jgi:hypothetical protein